MFLNACTCLHFTCFVPAALLCGLRLFKLNPAEGQTIYTEILTENF